MCAPTRHISQARAITNSFQIFFSYSIVAFAGHVLAFHVWKFRNLLTLTFFYKFETIRKFSARLKRQYRHHHGWGGGGWRPPFPGPYPGPYGPYPYPGPGPYGKRS